jgi:Fe-S cluster assembly iron-binding protein IscA
MSMLTVTERAKVTLARLKVQALIQDADVGLRLSLAESEPGRGLFGLRADRETQGDQVVEYGGTKILLVEEALADALADATIDAEPTGQGDDLVISQPGQIEAENGDAEGWIRTTAKARD